MSELIPNREEQIKSTIDKLRNRTDEEKADDLAKGMDMLVQDLPENREFYARMQGLAALKSAGVQLQSDRLHASSRRAYGVLGYETGLPERHTS